MKKALLSTAILIPLLLSAVEKDTSIDGSNSSINETQECQQVEGYSVSCNEDVIGYSSARHQMAKTACYRSDKKFTKKHYNNIKQVQEIYASTKDASSALGLDISGGGGTPMTSGEGSFGYSSSEKSSKYTLSYYQGASMTKDVDIDYKTLELDQILNPYGMKVYNKYKTTKDTVSQDFSNECGDTIAQSIKKRALFLVKINLEFASSEQAEGFKASLKGSHGPVELGAALKSESANSKSTLSIKTEVFAEGFKSDILGGFVDLSECNSLNSIDKCQAALTKVGEFVKSEKFQKSFDAVSLVDGVGKLTNIEDLTDTFKIEPLAKEEKLAQDKFSSALQQYKNHEATYNRIFNFFPFADGSNFKKAVNDSLKGVTALKSKITNSRDRCFDNPKTCSSRWSELVANSKENITKLNELHKSYDDYKYRYLLPIYDLKYQQVKSGASNMTGAFIPLYNNELGMITPYLQTSGNKILKKHSIINNPGTTVMGGRTLTDRGYGIFQHVSVALVKEPGVTYNSYEENKAIITLYNPEADGWKDTFISYMPKDKIYNEPKDASNDMSDALKSGKSYSLKRAQYITNPQITVGGYTKWKGYDDEELKPLNSDFYPKNAKFELENQI